MTPAASAWWPASRASRSNSILKKALTCVCNLIHRGAMDADAKTGDGAGVLTQIPYKLFRPEVEKMGYKLFQDSDLGVGMMFLPNDPYTQARCRHITETVLNEAKLFIFGWRVVPVNRQVLGEKALRTCPDIEQILVGRPDPSVMSDDEFERKLFLVPQPDRGPGREPGHQGFLYPELLEPHHRLQGPARRADARALLPRPARPELHHRARRFPPALQHEHVPDVAAVPVVPHAQRTTAKSTRSWATGSGPRRASRN